MRRPVLCGSAVLALAVAGLILAGNAALGAPEKPKGPEPIRRPVMFDTPEADEILKSIQLWPKDHPYNWDISYYPVMPNSKPMIEAMGEDGTVRPCRDFSFIIVPPDQKKIPVDIWKYAKESDPGPYPVPDCTPIQSWPLCGGTLDEIQRTGDGDRHAIVLDPWNGRLYEFYHARKTAEGWTAKQASIFKLGTNHMRPLGWASSTAAGLAELAGAARFDECESGMVRHPIGVTMEKTRAAHVFPARHFASDSHDPNLPRMGERLRLRAEVDIRAFSKHAQAIALGMKTYGLIVCDNGRSWDICLTCDKRLQGVADLMKLTGKDFEVIDAAKFIPPLPPPPPPKKTRP